MPVSLGVSSLISRTLFGIVAAVPSAFAASALEVQPAPAFVSEAEASGLVGQAVLSTCMLGTTKVVGVDYCTYTILGVQVPMICTRVNMNSGMAIIEGSDMAGFLGYAGSTQVTQMAEANANCNPSEKRLPAMIGDMVSSSVSTHGHIANFPLLMKIAKQVIQVTTAYNLCQPTYELTQIPVGYAFLSEGDHFNGTEFGNWRASVSSYWFIPWLVGVTSVARFMEKFGFCEGDLYRVFCYGGWGTRYPATGSNPSESRGLGLIDSAYDGFNVTTAPMYTYGALHINPGASICIAAHLPQSYLPFGVTANMATFQRGGWYQPFYPIRAPACIPIDTPATDPTPTNTLNMPQAYLQPIAETNQIPVQDQNRVTTGVLWPRFTCCNWCIGSNEEIPRHMVVGGSFDATLIPSSFW